MLSMLLLALLVVLPLDIMFFRFTIGYRGNRIKERGLAITRVTDGTIYHPVNTVYTHGVKSRVETKRVKSINQRG